MYPNPATVLPLPPRPNLEQYKKVAKDLVRACKSDHPDAIRAWVTEWIKRLADSQGATITAQLRQWIEDQANQLEEFARSKLTNSDARTPRCALANAQFVIARAHGFKSWTRLAKHIEALLRESSRISKFEVAADAVITGNIATLQRLLREDPDLIRARSAREHGCTLLHYIGANGFEGYRQKSPKNAVEVAKVLLNAGAEIDAMTEGAMGSGTTLGMVATSVHTERVGVHIALLGTLIDHGADVNGAPAAYNPLLAALHNDRPEAAAFLALRGARLDLEGAAGVGRLDVVKSFFNEDGSLKANATKAQLESGFIWACEYGHREVAEFLLEKGVDLRVGENTDQTALHLAAHRGQLEIVKLLLDRGASLEAKNVYGGTVLGQATWSVMHGEPSIDFVPVIETLIAAGAKIEEADYPTGNERVDEVLRRHRPKL
jgi:ankyrin repeat protein